MNWPTGAISNWVWGLFAVTILLDVGGQTAFKLGLAPISASRGARFWEALASSPLVVAGVAIYGLEACTWMYVLGHAPMSVVGPMAALSYVGAVVTASRLLRERVSRSRWWGAVLVSVGSACLAASAR